MLRTTNLNVGDSTFVENISTGTTNDENYSKSKQNPTRFIVGGGYTQGQEVRTLFKLNNNGPFVDQPTDEDIETAIQKDNSVFQSYPNLINYPFLSVIPQFNPQNTNDYPIYSNPGKGRGVVWWFNAGSSNEGNIETAQENRMSFYHSVGFDSPIRVSEPTNITTPRWPFSGKLYSGFLTQLDFDENVNVIPYQSGRGIPQWNPTDPYYSGAPYGIPLLQDIPVEAMLSEGASPNNNIACMGVVLETQYDTESTPLWKYPNIDIKEQWEPWDQHIASFNTSEKSESNKSPINSADINYAPWTQYYAYNTNDPVPILTKGTVAVPIGGATNIGAQVYYVPDITNGDDPRGNPNYIPVPIIPLFQGEKVYVGSQTYCTAQGQEITPRPVGRSPYPAFSYSDGNGYRRHNREFTFQEQYGSQMDGRRCNPYYDYYDATYGSVGWTSTPQFKLASIPDQGVTIASTLEGNQLEFLLQSLQGTCFVTAQTTTNPLNDGGSGRNILIGQTRYVNDQQIVKFEDFKTWDRWNNMTKFGGSPGRSLSIGNNITDITGTGQWTYKGTFQDTEQTTFLLGGIGYTPGTIYNTETNGSGSGMSIEVISVGTWGAITDFSVYNAGENYEIGDIVYPVDFIVGTGSSSIRWGYTLTWFESTAHFSVTGVGTLSLVSHGTGYFSETFLECVNMNNLTLSSLFTAYDAYRYNYKGTGPIEPIFNTPLDISRFPIGSKIGLYNYLTHKDNWVVYNVTENDGSSLLVTEIDKIGGTSAYPQTVGQLVPRAYSAVRMDLCGPTVRLVADSNGFVTDVELIELPPGNKEGDIILLNQDGSQKNCFFQLELPTPNTCKLIEGGFDYFWDQTFWSDQKVLSGLDNLTPNTISFYQDNIDTELEGFVGSTDCWGAIKSLFYRYGSNYTGEFQSILTIVQTVPFDISTQPVAGAQPANGWPSYVYRRTASTIINSYPVIILKGTGYTQGQTIEPTGGSGTGYQIWITKVSDIGEVEQIRVNNYGTGYLFGDTLTLGGGGAQIILRLPPTKEIESYRTEPAITGFRTTPYLYFGFDILDPGTGYTVGDITANADVTNIDPIYVNILSVDGSGAVLELEHSTTNFDQLTANIQIGNVFSSDDTGQGLVFQLTRPPKAQPITFTKGGSGYTTSTNVTTLNLSANNLNLITDFSVAGQALAIDYGASDQMPLTNDLSRYTIGDILAFDQDGNQTALAEITSLDVATTTITFNQINVGAGYVQPTGNYGFLPTVNTSVTETTVDIVANDDGVVTSVTINTLGTNALFGDTLLIEDGDFNAIVRLGTERDVPPQWQETENDRVATDEEWNNYNDIMKSSVNLLEHNAVVQFKKNYPWYYNESYNFYGDPDNKDPADAGWAESTIL